jgi:hypothetical protein
MTEWNSALRRMRPDPTSRDTGEVPVFQALWRPLLVVTLMLVFVGCTKESAPISDVQLPQVDNTPIAVPLQNDQTLRVTIIDGHFASTLYDEQAGVTRLLVISVGGPYLFQIDNLVDRRELPADGGTDINFDASAPGQYTMHAYTSTPTGPGPEVASAVLDIQTVGGR